MDDDGSPRPKFYPWRAVTRLMSERYHVDRSVWKKWTFHELWIYVSGAYDPGTIKRFGEGQETQAVQIVAQRRYEKAKFFAAILGEEIPEEAKIGQSKLIVTKRRPDKATINIAR